ncbi:MAG: GNAT family N-acetyltransferase [Saprospiraceae bacterium]|nr:GNAT family N-acetyltransferase [Saprospiraceae bacterium]
MKDTIYRSVAEEDLVAVAEIFNESIQLGDATLWERTFSPEDLSQEIADYDSREGMYVLQYKGEVIGFGVIRLYHPKKGYRHTCVTSVFLNRKYTGQGLGTPFKRFILDECKRLDYHHVVAKILASNEVSIKYNLRLGYRMVGIQHEAGRQGDRWVDVAILQYIIR